MTNMSKQEEEVKQLVEELGAKFEALGVKYFIGTVDRDEKHPEGGTAISQFDATGEDLSIIFDMALPTKEDAINMGVWIGNVLHRRNQEK